MINLLVWGDYVCSTGFGTVTRNIMQNLHKTGDFNIDVIGINYDGDPYDHEQWPGNVYPALLGKMIGQGPYGDVFGRQRVLDALNSGRYDAFFMVQDTFVALDFMEQLKEVCDKIGTRIIFYYPIDAQPLPNWITDVVSKVDYPIAYTNYAKAETVKVDPDLENIEVVYHGTNLTDFYPDKSTRDELRKTFFRGFADNKFLILNLNRNQPRKDILRSLLILKELKEKSDDYLLYLHMAGHDVGGDIDQWAQQLGLEYGKDYIYPGDIGNGYPVSALNKIYNAADCLLTTTHGEGWGLSITEAMATKLPIVAPSNTSLTEMLADNRGKLVPSGKTYNEWLTFGLGDNNRLRPLMSVHLAVKAIEEIKDGKLPDVEGAYEWVQKHTWEIQTKEFERIIRKAASERQPVGHTLDGQVVKLNREQRRKLAKAKR